MARYNLAITLPLLYHKCTFERAMQRRMKEVSQGNRPKRKPLRREQKVLLAVAMVFVVYIFAFCYVPIAGWGLSVFRYKPAFGLNFAKQKFVGLDNFVRIWNERSEVLRVLRNTLALSALGLICSPLPMILAILFSELRSKKYMSFVQTVTTFPNFISWIIVYGVCYTIFSNTGVWANAVYALTGQKQVMGFLSNVNTAWGFQTFLGQWKSLGWNAIIYCAAIAGIDDTLYEAAKIDGANRFQQIWHVTLPGLKDTFFVLFLLSISNILSSGFDHYFVFNNPMVSDKLMVLDLWTYQLGIGQADYSYSIAVGIIKTFVSLILLFTANGISKKIRGYSIV